MALGTHLNLADTFPRDAQLRTDLVQRAAAAIRDTVAQPENSGLAFGKLKKKQPDFLNGLVLAHSGHRSGVDVIRQKLRKLGVVALADHKVQAGNVEVNEHVAQVAARLLHRAEVTAAGFSLGNGTPEIRTI